MSAEEQQQEAQAAEETAAGGLLDQIVQQMPKSVKKDRANDLVGNLVQQVMDGTVKWSKSVTKTVNDAIAQIDGKMSEQLAAILHHSDFQKLEGSWRGLHHLVMNTETSKQLKLRVLNISKKDLYRDLDKAVEFDQSQIFKKIYESEFGMPGGEPYGALVGDFEFTNHPDDIDLLEKMSGVCAAAHCPFVSAASESLFGFDSWTDLTKPRDIEKIFMAKEYTKWNSFRDSPDSRFVTLVMPRVLARLPYGASTKPIDEFGFEEVELDKQGNAKEVPHDNYCWMNAAYVMGAQMTATFAKTGWCTAIRGVENGGKVEG
ncbi:MAG: type VI secretion system contractile sheath large subunit, partial [Planctomycetaceae bacterium]